MIINGGSRSNGAFFAKHLTSGEQNERVTICEMRNLAAGNIPDAFREMEAVALGTLCRNYFYHATVNPRVDEELTSEQWTIAAETLERNLRLDAHARFIVEHRKHGRTHRHIVWSRIDVRTMRAVVMTDDYEKHQATARELEKAFNLEPVPSVLGRTRAFGPRPARRAKTWESFRGQLTGIDPLGIRRTVTELYRSSNDGAEFAASLAEHGYTLVRGNRAEFCIRDSAGQLHSLARRIEGIRSADLKALMSDALPGSLPTAVPVRPPAND